MASSALVLSSQAILLKQGSSFLRFTSGTTCSRLRGGSANLVRSGGLRLHERQWKSKRGLSVSAVTESPEETVGDKPEFKLKVEYEEESTTSAPDRSKWTGYVTKDTAGQENIYSVEPTVYVADNMLSTNSQGTSGSSTSTLAFVGTVILFTLLAAGSAFNISQYKADVTAPGNLEEYSGPPLSYYLEKFSESPEAAAPEAAEKTRDIVTGAEAEVVPYILDTKQDLAPADLLSVSYLKPMRSPLVPLAVSFSEGLEAPALVAEKPAVASASPALVGEEESAAPVLVGEEEASRAEESAEPVLIAEALPSLEESSVTEVPASETAEGAVAAAASAEDSSVEAVASTEAGEPLVALGGGSDGGAAEESATAAEVEFEYNEAELPPEMPAEDLASFVEVSDEGGDMTLQNPLQTTIEE